MDARDKVLKISRRRAVTVSVLGSVGLLAGCAAPASTPSSAATAPAAPVPPSPAAKPRPAESPAPAKPAAASKPPAAPTAAPKAAAKPRPEGTRPPAKPQTVNLRIVQTATSLTFAPMFLAQAMKYFEDEAINLDHQILQGAGLTTAAILSGEAQFQVSGSNDHLASNEKGLNLLAVSGLTTSLSLDVAARKAYLDEKGVTPQSPLPDKIAALKGAKIGVVSPAGAPAQFTKYLLKLNGLDPENDAELVVIGSGARAIAAFREARVDAFVLGPPEPQVAEQEAGGAVFIRLSDEIPVFKDFIFAILGGRREWIEQNTGITERVCRALGRANNLLLNDLPAATQALRGQLPIEVSPQIFERAVARIQPMRLADGRMTEPMWKNVATALVFAGTISEMPQTAEGVHWTNRYIVNVPQR